MGNWSRVVLLGATVLSVAVPAGAQDTLMEAMVQWRRQKSPPAEQAQPETSARHRPVVVPGRRRPVVLREPQGTIVVRQTPATEQAPQTGAAAATDGHVVEESAPQRRPSAIDTLFDPAPPHYAAPPIKRPAATQHAPTGAQTPEAYRPEPSRSAPNQGAIIADIQSAAAPAEPVASPQTSAPSQMDESEAAAEFAVPAPPKAEKIAKQRIVANVETPAAETAAAESLPSEMLRPGGLHRRQHATGQIESDVPEAQAQQANAAAFPVPAVPTAPQAPPRQAKRSYTLPDEMKRLRGVPAQQQYTAQQAEYEQQTAATAAPEQAIGESDEGSSLLGTAIRAMHKTPGEAKAAPRRETPKKAALLPSLGVDLTSLQQRLGGDASSEGEAALPSQQAQRPAAEKRARRKQTLADMFRGDQQPEAEPSSNPTVPPRRSGKKSLSDLLLGTEPAALPGPSEMPAPQSKAKHETAEPQAAAPTATIPPVLDPTPGDSTRAADQIAQQQRSTRPPAELLDHSKVQQASALSEMTMPNRLTQRGPQASSPELRSNSRPAQPATKTPAQPTRMELYSFFGDTDASKPASCAAGGCATDCGCANVCAPCAGGWFGGAGVYYLKPHWDQHVALAVVEGADVNATLTSFDYEFDPSLYVYAGFVGSNGVGIRGGAWYFDQTASRAATVVAGTSVATMEILDTELMTNVVGEQIQANSRTEFQVYDLEAIARFGTGNWSAQVGGGMRYLSLDQDYEAQVFDTGGNATARVLNSYYSFQGVGPTVSLEARRACGLSGLSLYGQGRFSTVFGETEQRGMTAMTAWQRQNWGVVGIGELELGGVYTAPLAHVTLVAQTGVVGQLWLGAGNATNSQLSDSNLGLFGVRSQLGFTY